METNDSRYVSHWEEKTDDVQFVQTKNNDTVSIETNNYYTVILETKGILNIDSSNFIMKWTTD